MRKFEIMLYSPSITTVITTYNRGYCLFKAIQSALDTFEMGYTIVVDDASTDGTVADITNHFSDEINRGVLTIIPLEKNVGVTAAKNIGFNHAKTDWVLFLDSDDTYLSNMGKAILDEFQKNKQCPLIFFRCQDQQGNFIGKKRGEAFQLDLKTYLHYTSFGEALTAINKTMVDFLPYLDELRGYEGLGCCRIIKAFGPALLSSIIARVYYIGNSDALSSLNGTLNRAKLLAAGHKKISEEFRLEMDISQYLSYRIKWIIYTIVDYIIMMKRWFS